MSATPATLATAGLRTLLLVVVVLFAAQLVACGGGKARGSFDGNVYRSGPIAFRLPEPPSSWRRIEVDDASLAFRDPEHDASVLLNARCLSADDRTPLVALTNHLLIGATEREFLSQGPEPFDGREALHTKLKAKWDGVPMMIDVFVLSKDGCVYDFVYLASPSGFEGGAPAFESFSRGFRTLPGSGVAG
ncbi:MAG: hypothetical protein K0S65_1419 [Labilithrix sp.]|nr:hypothetical protein [Labilithrix sp.]